MKATRIILTVLCAALILCMPLFLSAPIKPTPAKGSEEYHRMLEEKINNALTETDDEEVIDFDFDDIFEDNQSKVIEPVPDHLIGLFVSAARAEETAQDDDVIVEPIEDGFPLMDPNWKLPFDFSAGPRPNPTKYTENGYEDESIKVRVETKEMYGITVHIAYVQIADPSQLRTAVAGNAQNNRTDKLKAIAGSVNPVVAMNGDDYTDVPEKKTFELRMCEKVRAKTNKVKDILVIDDLGDFHLMIRSKGLHKEDKPYLIKQMKEEGRFIVNALTFGPALVKDGELVDQKQNEDYSYNPNRKEPRSAIGQTGKLSYVMVVASGVRGTKDSGATFQELAQIMYDLGCVQAYNLDGGGTAEMLMFGPDGTKGEMKFHFKADENGGYRSMKDIIYFATAVPESEW